MKKLVNTINAIPTLFNGVKYKSRLEARFAEYLFNCAVAAEYEKPLPYSRQGYIPDFFLGDYGIYVEIKPRKLLKENGIFTEDINDSGYPWVCIDKIGRNLWGIIDYNSSFLQCRIAIPCRIGFETEFKLYPKYWEVPKVVKIKSISEHARLMEDGDISQMPASWKTKAKHFAEIRAAFLSRS